MLPKRAFQPVGGLVCGHSIFETILHPFEIGISRGTAECSDYVSRLEADANDGDRHRHGLTKWHAAAPWRPARAPWGLKPERLEGVWSI